MSELPRRSIEELAARYELEPTLEDIFVEGWFDHDVLSEGFRKWGMSDRVVYTIETVDVPSALLVSYGLTSGNKQRVISLARSLMSLPQEAKVRFLVDKDLDHWFDNVAVLPKLLWTVPCALELYFCTEDFLREFLLSGAKAKIPNWAAFISSYQSVLKLLYAFKLADRQLAFDLKWITPDRCLQLDGDRIGFDSAKYITLLLQKNSRSKERAAFEASVSDWSKKLVGPISQHAHGHDFVALIVWSIEAYSGLKEFRSSMIISRLFVMAASRSLELKQLVSI